MSDFLKTYEILNNATKFDKDLPNLAKQTKQYSSFIQTDRNQGHDLMQFSCKSPEWNETTKYKPRYDRSCEIA